MTISFRKLSLGAALVGAFFALLGAPAFAQSQYQIAALIGPREVVQ